MSRLVSLFFVAAVAQAATASADEFADVDPIKLAKSIEKLGEAWTIDVVVADEATDDFADDDLFRAKEPEEIMDLAGDGGGRNTELEPALLNLGTGQESGFTIRRIGER
jgi:hypothetical protein